MSARRLELLIGGRFVVIALVAAVAFLAAGPPPTAQEWHGTIRIHGMIYEPEGHHPYTTTIDIRLREGERTPVEGGVRTALISEGSVYTVETSVYQSDGLLICSGTGTETFTGISMGYLESIDGETTYHLILPRAFGAFACGTNHRNRVDRGVIIGHGEHEARTIETEDPEVRTVENGVMQGSWQSTRSREPVRYEYDVRWSISRRISSQ